MPTGDTSKSDCYTVLSAASDAVWWISDQFDRRIVLTRLSGGFFMLSDGTMSCRVVSDAVRPYLMSGCI